MNIESSFINLFKKENIIDLRDNFKYLKKHINGSKNIRYDYLIVNPEKYLRKDEKYLLICDLGLQSMDVSKILNKQGYLTYSLKGGFNSFTRNNNIYK